MCIRRDINNYVLHWMEGRYDQERRDGAIVSGLPLDKTRQRKVRISMSAFWKPQRPLWGERRAARWVTRPATKNLWVTADGGKGCAVY